LSFITGLIAWSLEEVIVDPDVGCDIESPQIGIIFDIIHTIIDSIVNLGFLYLFIRPIQATKSTAELCQRTSRAARSSAAVVLVAHVFYFVAYYVIYTEATVSLYGLSNAIECVIFPYALIYTSKNWHRMLWFSAACVTSGSETGKNTKKQVNKSSLMGSITRHTSLSDTYTPEPPGPHPDDHYDSHTKTTARHSIVEVHELTETQEQDTNEQTALATASHESRDRHEAGKETEAETRGQGSEELGSADIALYSVTTAR